MTEFVIYGRGGQGGVTLAKLVAMTYFLQDRHVQAFGVYAAERSGAPLRAFVRVDSQEITCRNQVYEPDHVVVLDGTLINDRIVTGLKPGGWVILNAPEKPEAYAVRFAGYRVAAIDATAVAVANSLGTRTTPIVNTTMLGAVSKVLGEPFSMVEAALEELGFLGPNVTAARQAYEQVAVGPTPVAPPLHALSTVPSRPTLSILDSRVGDAPQILTGAWARRRPQQRESRSPCNDGCPAGNDVRGFLAAVRQKDLSKALEVLLRTSPFPGVCGRVCPAPCMEACHRRGFDESVNVRDLERYVADHASPPGPEAPLRREKTAVVGAGPAGLSACYHLARLGYLVSLYESGGELGGVMRTGIPAYRLPREVLDREIAHILRHGVEAHIQSPVGRKDLLALSSQYAAVFVATGLQEARSLRLGNNDPARVMQGITFLDDARQGEVRLDGERIVVVGGGNTACDAARTAVRLGASEVRLVYRRSRAEMPAIREEVEEAIEEGVKLHELLAPIALVPTADRLSLRCQRMRLGELDASGRRSPTPCEGPDSFVELVCERVVLALGQVGDLAIFPEGSEIRDGRALVGLSEAPVFAGGDLVGNEGTVAAAIAAGRRAAWHIHRTLSGEDLFPRAVEPVVSLSALRFTRFQKTPQRASQRRASPSRLSSFEEVRLGLQDLSDHAEAWDESLRCLSCGSCTQCDVCRENCPEGILARRGDEYAFNYDYCKGCGLCAAECPRGVVYMEQL